MKFYTVTQFSEQINYSRYAVYKLIEKSTIKTVVIGYTRIIEEREAAKWIDRVKKYGKWNAFRKVKNKKMLQLDKNLGGKNELSPRN